LPSEGNGETPTEESGKKVVGRKDHEGDSSLPSVAQNDNGEDGCLEWYADFSAFSFLKTNLDSLYPFPFIFLRPFE
jgi:hypothetical protein